MALNPSNNSNLEHLALKGLKCAKTFKGSKNLLERGIAPTQTPSPLGRLHPTPIHLDAFGISASAVTSLRNPKNARRGVDRRAPPRALRSHETVKQHAEACAEDPLTTTSPCM